MIRSTRSACLLVVAAFALAAVGAQAQQTYSVNGGGGQGQIGNGLPLPIQQGQTPGGNQVGTGTMFPPLLIPVVPGATVKQTLVGPVTHTTTMGTTTSFPHTLKVPMGVFQIVPSGPQVLGVAHSNPTVWQVKTRLQFTGPGFTISGATTGTNTFSAGGRTGLKTTTFMGIPSGSSNAKYFGSINQFGGPSPAKVQDITPVVVWGHASAVMEPCKHTSLGGGDAACVAALFGAFPDPTVAAGNYQGFTNTSPGTPVPMNPGQVGVNVDTAGNILSSTSFGPTGLNNMANSAGFPWTTGMLRLTQTEALGVVEAFTITGADNRSANGEGTLSLVAGALSDRTVSGPNANKTWARYVLPEPVAVLGTAAALAALGLCHGLVRRRSR